MSVTLKFSSNVTVAQEAIVPDATLQSDGMMTALMTKKLDTLWAASGLPLPVVTPRFSRVFVTPSVTGTYGTILGPATQFNDGVVTAAQVQALEALWIASGLSTTAPYTPVKIRLDPCSGSQRQEIVILSATDLNGGFMTALMVAKLVALLNKPTYTQVITADHPKLWWRFNDASPSPTVLDTEGLANGTLGSGTLYQQPGLITEAGQFSQGASSSTYGVTGAVIGLGVIPVAHFSLEWWLQNTSGNHNYVGFKTNSNLDEFFMGISSGTAGNYQNNHFFQTLPNGTFPNAPTYFTVTYDGTTVRVYKNGVQISTKVGLIGGTSITQLLIGRAVLNTTFAAFIDEVALYDHVLTPTQILNHFTVGRQ